MVCSPAATAFTHNCMERSIQMFSKHYELIWSMLEKNEERQNEWRERYTHHFTRQIADTE